MASVSHNKQTGRRCVQFKGVDGTRKTLRLGKMSAREADSVRIKVEALLASRISGMPLDREMASWLGAIPGDFFSRLAAVGLVERREGDASGGTRIGVFINRYIAGRHDQKPGTVKNMKVFAARLVGHFGADRDMRTVKRSDADAFAIWVRKKFAPSTAGRTIAVARHFFLAAIRAEVVNRNPFDGISTAGKADKTRQRFIDRDTIQKVLDACPDAEWRLFVALSRFAGLRCSSEHCRLTWGDVNWSAGRFRVTSPKTERYEGKGDRWVPLFPELRPFMEEVFEQAPPGTVHVISKRRWPHQGYHSEFERIIRKAGVSPWPKLFNNLRSSWQTELANHYPEHVVCRWMGNSRAIAMEHYLQVTDDHFQRAAQAGAADVRHPGDSTHNQTPLISAPPGTIQNTMDSSD